MGTYFVRHTESCAITSEERAALWNAKTIAIHYEDNRSTNPVDYEKEQAKRALRTFNKIADEGGYVCATFQGKGGCLVGRVAPQTPIIVREAENRADDPTNRS